MKLKTVFFILMLLACRSLHAQDLWNLLDSAQAPVKEFTVATFKTTRLIDQHTLETVGKNTLDFRISHRFGPLNSRSINAWGIDGPVDIRLGLEYSPDGRFMFGIGRTSVEKMVDGFLKYRLLRQSTHGGSPLSITLFASAYRTGLKDNNTAAQGYDKYKPETNRWSYAYEIMIGRKFSPAFSFQIAPWFVHYNLVELITDKNDAYGVACVTRLKFTKRMAITFEYAYRINEYSKAKYYDSMGIGWEIETGGHVFQVHFINSFGLVENQFLAHTDTKWNNAGIRLGFNVSRVFTL
ncbi:MAG: DUF5777 family beta-barrel protein [Bacteroidetes bacterium]|nr:DUF5777 family beta-barrel protein [Bacteroidota bacterium]